MMESIKFGRSWDLVNGKTSKILMAEVIRYHKNQKSKSVCHKKIIVTLHEK